jgi:hypothetical protein
MAAATPAAPLDGMAALKAQIDAVSRDYIVEPRTGAFLFCVVSNRFDRFFCLSLSTHRTKGLTLCFSLSYTQSTARLPACRVPWSSWSTSRCVEEKE